MNRVSQSGSSRRQLRRQATIDEILDIARAIMREEGAAALNLNEVARRIGVKPPSLYEYFPGGKLQIYDALFAYGFRRFGEYLAPAFQIEEPWASLEAALQAYLAFALDYPELFRICFERPVPGFVPSEESMELSLRLLARATERVAGALEHEAIHSPFKLEHVRDIYIALMHGIAALHLANEPDRSIGQGRFASLPQIAITILRAALKNCANSIDGGDAR